MTQPFSTGRDRSFVEPGSAGTVLTSNGSTLNPSYQSPQSVPSGKKIISSAQLLALPTAAPGLVVLPSPGAGKILVIDSMLVRYVFNTTPYTLGNADNSLGFIYNGPNGLGTQSVALA